MALAECAHLSVSMVISCSLIANAGSGIVISSPERPLLVMVIHPSESSVSVGLGTVSQPPEGADTVGHPPESSLSEGLGTTAKPHGGAEMVIHYQSGFW